jgi:putative ABC transport system permease protein
MLVYARIVSRQEEIAIRTALGASRGRIVLQLFIEMFVLSTLSVCLALAAVRFVLGIVEQAMVRELARLPFWISFDLSLNTVLLAVTLAALAALIVGVVPAIKATSSYASPGLSALDRRHKLRLGPLFTVLIVGQIAFSFAALPSAIELAWGVLRSDLLGPGFAADRYLTAQLGLDIDAATSPGPDDDSTASRFRIDLDRLARQLEADPRLASDVSIASAVPGEGPWRRFRVEDLDANAPPPTAAGIVVGAPLVRQISVDDRYFDVFGVPVLTGRGFRSDEFDSASRAVLIDATFARNTFGDTNPLGRRLSYLSPAEATAANVTAAETWYEIVGVVADRPSHPYRGSVFHAAAPGGIYPARIGFRMGPDAASLREDLRAMARTIDPALRVQRVLTLQEIYDGQAFGTYVGGFALITGSLSVLLLAAAGTYALMSFTVNHRRREIAIRMALGARPRSLLGGIFRRAIRQMSAGAALGLVVALLVRHYIPVDRLGGLEIPGVLPGAIAFLVAIGLMASAGPARRALSAEPSEVLRDGA